MMKYRIIFLLLSFAVTIFNCNNDDGSDLPVTNGDDDESGLADYRYLALGDSYTIGQSVCAGCRFPAQLTDSLENRLEANIHLDIIAQTGWTTTNLLDRVNAQNPSNDYDLVTLLIGVNNQYQGRPFSIYETEFRQLLDKAITLAKGDYEKVIVVSIPDYAYTPFGQSTGNSQTISQQIDTYNSYALSVANELNVSFVNITDITRQGLDDPSLVASDGLHPSEKAYTEFVKRLIVLAQDKIQIQ